MIDRVYNATGSRLSTGEPAGEVVGASHQHTMPPGHEALSLFALLSHLSRPSHPAVPDAV